MGATQSDSTASFQSIKFNRNNSSVRASFDVQSSATKRKRGGSHDSAAGDFGWYEDFETNSAYNSFTSDYMKEPLQNALTLPAPDRQPPMYVLEASLETQQLWYKTAGRRPQQPAEEREAIEREWLNNFQSSEIEYLQNGSLDSVTSAGAGESVSSRTESCSEIIHRGKSQFSDSVSKSFANEAVSSMTIQMPSYRIVRNQHGTHYAEYLIIISLGGRGAVTFGIWKRHSHFEKLAQQIQELDARAPKPHLFKNTILSWQCVQQRKRWYKSLDTQYLELKCFLLERFIQDLLFESQSSLLLSRFLGLQ